MCLSHSKAHSVPFVGSMAGNDRIAQADSGSAQPMTDTQCDSLKVVEGTAQLSAAEYDRLIYDLVNFLEYVGEPTKAKAHNIGIYVLLFLMLYFVFGALAEAESIGRTCNKHNRSPHS